MMLIKQSIIDFNYGVLILYRFNWLKSTLLFFKKAHYYKIEEKSHLYFKKVKFKLKNFINLHKN